MTAAKTPAKRAAKTSVPVNEQKEPVSILNDAETRLKSLSMSNDAFVHIHGESVKQTPGYALFVRAYNDLFILKGRMQEFVYPPVE